MLNNQNLEKKKYEPLEQALRGQSELVKSRVYNLIVHWGIKPENEFFIIFIAIGQLLALVEDAPNRFDTSFNNFTDGIDVWTEKNIQVLNEIANKAKINERLAVGAEKLAESSTQLVQVCSELIIQLKESSGTENNLRSQPLTSEVNYEILLKIINEKLSKIETAISNLEQLQIQPETKSIPDLPKNAKQIWSINPIYLSFLLVLLCLPGILSWHNTNLIEQRTNWLLEKANRQDCLQGIKSATSIECTSLPSN